MTGYSRSQWYRRVRLLSAAGVIHPTRGRQNQTLLSSQDEDRLARLAEIEKAHAKVSVEACVETLRAELAERENEELRGKIRRLEADKRTLSRALQLYRHWTLGRVLASVRRWFTRRQTV